MKKYLLFLVFIAGGFMLVSSCRINVLKGEGNKITSAPTLSSFNAVDISLPIKTTITVTEGSQPGINLNGYENVIKHIKTKIKDNTLYLYTDLDETWTMDYDGITVEITLPAIKSLSLEGAADADVHGNISGTDFKLDISGVGNAVIDNINVDDFSSEVSGAANIVVKGGTVKLAKYEVSGAAKIKTFPLQTTETYASISGAGKGEVTASQKLTASISGAGSIKYKGHPADVNKDISGAGSIAEAN
jgi:hypothetical protein